MDQYKNFELELLNSDDRTIIGNPHPKFTWGMNNDFGWKGLDLSVFFQASQRNDLLSYTLMELNLLSGINNATTDALNADKHGNAIVNVFHFTFYILHLTFSFY